MPVPGGQKISPAVVPQVFALSPPLPPSPFHSWNNVPASSFGLLHIPCQKQKPFLTPDDQACSRVVWYVASAWGGGGGARMLPIYIPECQLQGEQRPEERKGLKEQGVQNRPDFKRGETG